MLITLVLVRVFLAIGLAASAGQEKTSSEQVVPIETYRAHAKSIELDGTPVKVMGTLTYNFVLND